MSKIETIKWADVKDGRYWMYDSAGEDQEPSSCTIYTNGVTYVYFDDLDVDGKAIVVEIDSLVDTVVFVPIVPPRFSDLQL